MRHGEGNQGTVTGGGGEILVEKARKSQKEAKSRGLGPGVCETGKHELEGEDLIPVGKVKGAGIEVIDNFHKHGPNENKSHSVAGWSSGPWCDWSPDNDHKTHEGCGPKHWIQKHSFERGFGLKLEI